MDLIALRDFRNTHEIDIKNPIHDRHIQKGAQFQIGGKSAFKDLRKDDQNLVILLNQNHCIGDGADEKLVRRMQDEVRVEERAEKTRIATVMSAGSSDDVVKKLIAALTGLTASPA